MDAVNSDTASTCNIAELEIPNQQAFINCKLTFQNENVQRLYTANEKQRIAYDTAAI